MTLEEYVALDRSPENRWEYVSGVAYAMAGGTVEHAAVTTNLSGALLKALTGKPCRPFQQVELTTAKTRDYLIPDVSVVCPPFERDANNSHALTSPVALFEVLSTSTADYDRGGKFQQYRTIPTLRHYVLVDIDAREVEHRQRAELSLVGQSSKRTRWISEFSTDGVIALEALGIELALDDLWVDLDRLAP